MIKEITIAVLGAAVVGMFGYIIKIEKNISGIEELKTSMGKVVASNRELEKTIVATKLTIVQNHPDINLAVLASTSKLREMTKAEVDSLSNALIANTDQADEFVILTDGTAVSDVQDKYDLTDVDIENYRRIVAFSPLAEPPSGAH